MLHDHRLTSRRSHSASPAGETRPSPLSHATQCLSAQRMVARHLEGRPRVAAWRRRHWPPPLPFALTLLLSIAIVGRPSTPVERIVKCEFAGAAATAKDPIYPDIPGRTKPALKTGIKTTLSQDYRLAVTAMRLATESGEVAPEWKMKKFSNVKAKISRDGSPAEPASSPTA